MALSAYFSGVMQISQSIASVDLPLLKRMGEMKRRHWREHPVYYIFNSKANPHIDSLKFRETAQLHALNWGNAFARIVRGADYRPKELYLLEPERMKIEVKNDVPTYIYRHRDGTTKKYDASEIFHLCGFGQDPHAGYSLVKLYRAAIGLGIKQEDFSNNFISKGVHTSGIVTHPGHLSEDAHKHLKESIEEQNTGTQNAGRIIVFEEGMTFEGISMPLKDAEFLASRTYQVLEMARILNMPPHKLKEMTHATFTNIEHQQIEYITDTIRPWAERWEKAIATQLLTPTGQNQGFLQHDLNQLLRGDTKTVMEAQRIGRYAGLMSANEARYNIGMNPLEDDEVGNRIWQPTNMIDASSPQAAGEEPVESGAGEMVEPGRPAGSNGNGTKKEMV